MKNSDAPVYPLNDGMMDTVNVNPPAMGLTKLEHFAAIAMQGLLASGLHQVDDIMCHEAWSAAEIMLKYQEKLK